MQIEPDLLFTWGAIAKEFPKNTVIFYENDPALYFYQILEGTVKMVYINEDGKELTVGMFEKGRSFGEPPLFIDQPYPAAAIAHTDTIILKLSKEKFFEMLKEHNEILSKVLQLFATRIYNKVVFSKNIINQKPEQRIRTFLDNFKKQCSHPTEKILIPYTRKEIADFTGLRVETVIRTVSQMSKRKKIEIKNHKLYY